MAAPLVLRAASGPGVGMGHVIRTSAVASALVDLGQDAVVVVDDEESSKEVRRRGLAVELSGADEAWCEDAAGAVWIDGFRDWSSVLGRLGERGVSRFLVENRAGRDRADFLVYPALHHVNDAWDAAHPERLCAGAGWIPLAPSVLATDRPEERDIDLLITFGGSDPLFSTERCLALLSGSGGRVAVSVGCHMEARRDEIETLTAGIGPHAHVLGEDAVLAHWMARSRLALTALGTTLYELAYFGTPAAILANFETDAEALAFYGAHGPHRPVGVADQLEDRALREELDRARGASSFGYDVPGLGEGALRLAQKLSSFA